MSEEKLSAARNEAEAARARLQGTFEELQARLEPSQLLDDAVSEVKERSTALARTAREVARDRPGIIAAAAGAAALLLAHRPILRLIRRVRGAKETSAADR